MLPRAQIDSNSVTRELARSTWFDKVVHATMFGVAVLLWSKALPGRRARWVFAASGVLAGTALEFLQHYSVRGRTGSLDDLLADAAGIAVVLIFLESRRNTL